MATERELRSSISRRRAPLGAVAQAYHRQHDVELELSEILLFPTHSFASFKFMDHSALILELRRLPGALARHWPTGLQPRGRWAAAARFCHI